MTVRARAPEALASIAAGAFTLLTVQVATGGRGFGLLNPNLAGLAAACASYLAVMMVRHRRTMTKDGELA